jgi:hypothetical protein
MRRTRPSCRAVARKTKAAARFELKSAAERIGVARQPFKANFAEERRIGRGKPAQFDPG